MAETTGIEWCHSTFNPWRGCVKVHEGCTHCYAETLSKRNPGTLGIWGANGKRVVAAESYWEQPLKKWNRDAKEAGEHRRVFCASLADVFEQWDRMVFGTEGRPLVHTSDGWQEETTEQHEGCSGVTLDDVRSRLFSLIDATPNLDWLLLTKRPENIMRMIDEIGPSVYQPSGDENSIDLEPSMFRENVWLGTSISLQEHADKQIPALLKCRDLCPVLFLSVEPMLGEISLRWPKWFPEVVTGETYRERLDRVGQATEYDGLKLIGWVICGCESGPKRRPMKTEWAVSLMEQCRDAGVPFFMKQMEVDGRVTTDINQFPSCLQVREFPGERR